MVNWPETAPDVRDTPGHPPVSPAVRLLSPGRLHRRPARRTALPPVVGRGSRRSRGHLRRVNSRGARPTCGRHHQRRPTRTISLDREAVAVLREHRRQQTEERLAAGSALERQRRADLHNPVGRTALPRHRDRAHDQADQPAQHVSHSPRPSRCPTPGYMICATCTRPRFLAGVPVHVVAARLGHTDPAVTLRVYSHVLRQHAVSVGDIFAQAVKGSR